MDFRIDISRQEIFNMLEAFMPVRISLTDENEDGEPEKWVEMYAPRDLHIEPQEGIFLDFSMRVNWPLPILPDQFTLKRISGSLRPEIVCVDGVTSLALSLNVAELDIKNIPDVIDGVIKDTVQKKLAAMRAQLIWKIAETTNVSVELPGWIDPRKVAVIEATDATVKLSTSGLLIEAPLSFKLLTGEEHDAQISFGESESLDEDVSLAF